MSVILTRDEFERLVVTLLNCEADAAWHKRCGTYDDATIAAMERRDEAWAALFAAYDAQAARIAELDAQCDKLASVLLKRGCDGMVSQCAEMEARIAELEADRDHWRNMVNDLEHNSIYLDSIAFYEGRHAEVTARIAELEAALHTLVDWPDNSEEPGIYDGGYCVYGCFTYEGADDEMHHGPCCPVTLARAVLSKEA